MAPVVSCARTQRNAARALGPLVPRGGADLVEAKLVGAADGFGESSSSGYGGQSVHMVQIGLGTFATVVQNLAGEPSEWDAVIAWLLESTGETRSEHVRVVGVEPVREHVQRLRTLAANLPMVRLVQAAISDEDVEEMQLQVLTHGAYEALLASVPEDQRQDLENDLTFVRNMSCVGVEHPTLSLCRQKAWEKYGVDIKLDTFTTEVWTYGGLCRDLNFFGCQVLLIDAEGHDAKILRSLVEYCREEEARGLMAWPDVIVFESAGLCDQQEGLGSEVLAVRQLEECGYRTFLRNHMNTDMVNQRALQRSPKLQLWVDEICCDQCKRNRPWPLTYCCGSSYCADCYCTWDES